MSDKTAPKKPHQATVGSTLVQEACLAHPDLPSRTLARMLFKENKGVWPSVEAARMAVLWRRGRHQTKGRPGCPDVVPSDCPNVAWRPDAYIPKSDAKAFTPFVLEVTKEERALVVGDIHVPYHDRAALIAALEEGRRKKCSIIILNGDTLDFHRLSRFLKDPRARSALGEIDAARQLLDTIDDGFPKARKIWKDGNHDERYDSYIACHAADVFEVVKEHASLQKVLELEDRGWEYVSEKRPIYAGKLTILHGHEYPTPVIGPVNAARGLFLRAKDSTLTNHHHQTSEHTEPTIRDKMITTWSLGCLCELHPMYARFNKWNHGAATVELAPSGDFKVHNFRIADGVLLN